VFLAALISAAVVLAQGHKVPAQSEFRDDREDRIRSDKDGVYADNVTAGGCVRNYIDPKSGFHFLWVFGSEAGCSPGRSVVLDFSDAVDPEAPSGRCPHNPNCCANDSYGQEGELDICGPNTLPDVRLIANSLFQDRALAQGTKVSLPFSLVADSGATAFLLEFEQPLAVDGDSDSYMRALTADSTSVAELYRLEKTFRKISLGRFYLPFQVQVTVTKQ